MFKPLELFIGLRYLRAKRRNRFVSFISFASSLGICLGVAALIVVLSVMNGFENELRDRLLSMTSHATVSGPKGLLEDWDRVVERARATPRIEGAAPYLQLDAMLAFGSSLSAARLRGIDPLAEGTVSAVGRHMLRGTLEDLRPDGGNIVLGRVLAMMLGVRVGDRLNVMVPRGDPAGAGVRARMQRFEVSGIFEIGIQDHDGVLALVNLDDAMSLAETGGRAGGVRLKFDDIFAAPGLVSEFVAASAVPLAARDWTIENASYFRAIRIEKTMMSLIMMLVVAVAAFNIVATLVMVVTDKQTDVAILRTFGLLPRNVVGIFVVQGTILGWFGSLLGVALGVTLALNVGTVLPALEAFFGFELFPASVYYITELPSDLHVRDVVWIAVTALLLTILSTIYPARRAARIQPAQALRYE